MLKFKSGMLFSNGHVSYAYVMLKGGKTARIKKDKINITHEGAGLKRCAIITIETEIELEEIVKMQLMDYSGDSVFNYYAGDNYKIVE